MYIIVGLGNPGRQYVETRHNVGFHVIDELADHMGIGVTEKKHKALCGKGILEGERVILAKPQTYMNLSGESVRELMDYYKAGPEEVVVVYDDVNLEPGQLRIRLKGSSGGHNGVKSIIACLGTQEFPRIKVGVGEKPPRMDLADYVLGRFAGAEVETMEAAYRAASEAVGVLLKEGAAAAMNRFNVKGQG